MANFLDSNYIPCDWRKVLSFIPMLFTYTLITFISYQFLWHYIPNRKGGIDSYSVSAIACRLAFCYFSGMTYAFLTRTYLMNPGYLPKWLRTPIALDAGTDAAQACKLVRVYNLRLWVANKLHSFDEFIQKEGEVGGQEAAASILEEEDRIIVSEADASGDSGDIEL